jgi:hypothetical protein
MIFFISSSENGIVGRWVTLGALTKLPGFSVIHLLSQQSRTQSFKFLLARIGTVAQARSKLLYCVDTESRQVATAAAFY